MAETEKVEIKLDDKALAEIAEAEANAKAGDGDKAIDIGDTVTVTEVTKPGPDDGVELLKKQLADLETQATAHRQAVQRAEQQTRDQAAETEKYRTEVEKTKVEVTDARYNMIVNAIDVAKRDSDLAKREFASAIASGDFNAAADAQEMIARAAARMESYEAGRQALESEAANAKERVEKPVETRQQPQQGDPVERYIAQYSPRTQDFLRSHRDFVTDPKQNNMLIASHFQAVAEGIQPDTDRYFDFIGEKMGAEKAQPATSVAHPNGKRPPAAPVSRQPSPQSGVVNGTIILSPQEREIAHLSFSQMPSGEAETRYAKELAKGLADGTIIRH